MRTLFRSTLIALAVLTSASAAMARPHNLPASKADAGTDAGSANANSPRASAPFGTT
jgi:hypothetical protein